MNLTLRLKTILSFFAIAIVPIAIVGFIADSFSSSALRQQAFNQLTAVRDIKKRQIEDYFKQLDRQMALVKNDSLVVMALTRLSSQFEFSGEIVLEEGNFMVQMFDERFQKIVNDLGWADLYLVSPKGAIVYNVSRRPDLGNVITGTELAESSLGIAYARSQETDNPDAMVLADFKPYAPNDNKPSAFAMIQVKDQRGGFSGYLVCQLQQDKINEFMSQRTGMGETGETFLVGPDRLMRSDSFKDPEFHSVDASFANPDKGSVNTEASNQALAGETGILTGTSYTGKSALTAFSPVTINGLNWALIAEIEEAEAFAPIRRLATVMLIVSVLIIAAVIPLAFLFSHTIVNPLRKLSGTIVGVEDTGDFNLRADVTSQDEIGQASIAFNSLMDALQTSIGIIVETMSDVAEGDLLRVLPEDQKGELLKLNRAINESIDLLGDTLRQVAQTSEEVNGSAAQLSDSAQSLSNGATDQAASLEETASSINQIEAQSKNNNQNAQTAQQLTIEALEIVKKSDAQMNQMLKSIEEINTSSKDVSKIIKVIDEIAFQTSLLALNAAVEAARAGKYGKGFAVVAEEVRNLAARSAEAAGNSTELIEKSAHEVERGVENAEKTAIMLNEIMNSVSKVNDMVSDISAASGEQLSGILEINRGLEHINQVVQQNTSVSEETAAAADELTNQATRMERMIAVFKLKREGLAAPALAIGYDDEWSPS